jgi:hypothetical protein
LRRNFLMIFRSSAAYSLMTRMAWPSREGLGFRDPFPVPDWSGWRMARQSARTDMVS